MEAHTRFVLRERDVARAIDLGSLRVRTTEFGLSEDPDRRGDGGPGVGAKVYTRQCVLPYRQHRALGLRQQRLAQRAVGRGVGEDRPLGDLVGIAQELPEP